MITFKDYLEHNHPEVLDEAWWHPLLAGAALAATGLAGGGPSAQGASPITSEIRNVNTQAKEEFNYLKIRFDKQLNKFGYKLKISKENPKSNYYTIELIDPSQPNSVFSAQANQNKVSDQIDVVNSLMKDASEGKAKEVTYPSSSPSTEPFVLGHGIKNPRGGGEIRR
jgi:hypothetical protein